MIIKKPKNIPNCLCGCNKNIEWKDSMRYNGLPKYIVGHNKTGKIFRQNSKPKVMPLCQCGCGNFIIWIDKYKYNPIPKFIYTHQMKLKRGLKRSKHIGLKVSNSKKGHLVSKETKQKIRSSLMGLKRTKKSRIKQGSSIKLEKHYNWQGGKSFEEYPREFKVIKESIRERDNYRCQECFRYQDELYSKTGRKYKLHVHHIDYNKKNCVSENLISLCCSCHVKTNYKRNDWINYFKEGIRKNV